MNNYNTRRNMPYTMDERFDFFDSKQWERAESVLNESYDGELTESERFIIVRAIRELYLDRDNYPRSFNLRIAKKFNTLDLNVYYDVCRSGYRKFYDTTLHTHDGNFYFGFNHN